VTSSWSLILQNFYSFPGILKFSRFYNSQRRIKNTILNADCWVSSTFFPSYTSMSRLHLSNSELVYFLTSSFDSFLTSSVYRPLILDHFTHSFLTHLVLHFFFLYSNSFIISFVLQPALLFLLPAIFSPLYNYSTFRVIL